MRAPRFRGEEQPSWLDAAHLLESDYSPLRFLGERVETDDWCGRAVTSAG